MIIFAILIVLSIVFYIYYKVAILRTKDTLTQHYFNAKSRICLGIFLISIAINQYIVNPIKLILFVSIVFLVLGGMQTIYGFNEAKHYRKEWKRLRANVK